MYSLGIGYLLHDSSACLAKDGEIIFATAEERLSRTKHDSGFPIRAIKACLQHAGITASDLDYVCFGWPRPFPGYCFDLKTILSGRLPRSGNALLAATLSYLKIRKQQVGWKPFQRHFGPVKAKPLFLGHHQAHAISAYSFSGFQEATILVVDGRGSWEATSVWHGRDGRLEPVWTIPWPNSLGLFYAAFTDFLGFERYSDEWKVMGLAPYGSPGINLDRFINTEDNPYRVDARRLVGSDTNPLAGIEEIFGPRRTPESEIDDHFKDIAYAVQDACERAMLQLVRRAIAQTGCRNLCLAGGVALNSKANGKIQASGMVNEIFVQPAAADDGIALGAALAPHLETDGRLPLFRQRHAYWGPSFRDDEVKKILDTYKIAHQQVEDPASVAAEMLAEGKILGWFQGRMEFGPRALGSRSILADPRQADMKDKVNNAVKFREWWRPFAPSMLADAAAEFLEHPCDSPFMILTFQVKPEKRAVIPGVTHVDGSVRVQTLEEDVNPRYWRLLSEFNRRTGVPVVMNTSFNLRGEPIVCTPTDAIRTFFSSGLDALILGSYVIEK